MNTRAMAAAILLRIRDHGAYSNVLLPRATKDLRAQDRSFVYSLVNGALRNIRSIDAVIEAVTGREIAELDDEVGAVLQIAVGEMMLAETDTSYATVNEAVNAVKYLGRPRASGLVNGALRRLSREGLPELPGDRARDLSVPEWVLGRITQDHGRKAAGELLTGLRTPGPDIAIRVRPGRDVPEAAAAIAGIDGAYTVAQIPEASDDIVITDGSSSAVAQAVGAEAGESVLDMAAAPGGKTIALWDQTDGSGRLVAMDAHPRRLRSARDRLSSISVRPSWVQGDGEGTPFRDGSFDAVLLDAPCSGLGTLRRRPEIAMRLKTKRVADLADRQRAMLKEAWRVTRPGGRIIYSVCTLFATESTEIVADYPARAPTGIPGQEWGSGLLLAPHITGTDGMFVSVIER